MTRRTPRKQATSRLRLAVLPLAVGLVAAACSSGSDSNGPANTETLDAPPEAIENSIDVPGACMKASDFPIENGVAAVELGRGSLDAGEAVLFADCMYSLQNSEVVTITPTAFRGTVVLAQGSKIDDDLVRFGLEITDPPRASARSNPTRVRQPRSRSATPSRSKSRSARRSR